MTRRPAATLLEVLVAIFVMGIGLLAILTLFPLGALRMQQAIQDDRAAHISANANSIAQTYELRSDPLVTAAFRKPGGGLPDAHPDGPGYPVYVDAVGWQILLAPGWVGGVAGIPRRPASYVMNGAVTDPAKVLRWFTFLDDVRFGPGGVPANPVEREADYSWAYLLRCPRSSEAIADMSVVVYRRRPLSPTNNFTGDEYAYDGSLFTPTTNTILINASVAGRAAPPIRPGSWILDGTVKGPPYPHAHAYFYRVVSVTEVPNATNGGRSDFEVEVATPLRGWTAQGPGRVIVMDNVIEVFERGTGWAQ
ncbi:MAG: hypothetical protein L0Z62_08375 [Gemmataceae bacterium]|nr:hypothetical protein [Gemmataceae bacterium]